jgi:hypothetical protein
MIRPVVQACIWIQRSLRVAGDDIFPERFNSADDRRQTVRGQPTSLVHRLAIVEGRTEAAKVLYGGVEAHAPMLRFRAGGVEGE